MGQEGKEERIKSKEFKNNNNDNKVFKSLPTLSAQNCDSREIFLLHRGDKGHMHDIHETNIWENWELQTDSETRRISSVVINRSVCSILALW